MKKSLELCTLLSFLLNKLLSIILRKMCEVEREIRYLRSVF